MAIINLEVITRDPKKNATVIRAERFIPAVMYGHGVQTRSVVVPASDFRKAFAEAGTSSLLDVHVDGTEAVKAVIKEVQLHPLTMQPLHVDLHQVNMKEKMTAEIPLVFVGESDAVKALGGTLVKTMTSIEVECLPADLPHEITIDISTLKTFDDSISVADLALPKGVVATNEATSLIATVDAPLTAEELAKLEESQVGDVTSVKSEAEEKKAAEAAAAAAEAQKNEGNGS